MKIILTEFDIINKIRKILNESDVDVSGIVHDHIDKFVDETLNNFTDCMMEIENDLSEKGIQIYNKLSEAERHFEKEMLNLSVEIIHKIHEDEEIQKHFNNSSHNNFIPNH